MKKEPRKEVEEMAKKWMDYSMIVRFHSIAPRVYLPFR
jgi:hypothetical protein